MQQRVAVALGMAFSWVAAPVLAAPAAMIPAEMAAEPRVPASRPDNDTCNLAPARRFVGTVLTSQVQADLSRAISHNRVRVIRPGAVITQDLRSDRVNLIIDETGKVMTIRCG